MNVWMCSLVRPLPSSPNFTYSFINFTWENQFNFHISADNVPDISRSTHKIHDAAFQNLRTELAATIKIESQTDMQRILALAEEFRQCLPGPATPEMLTRTDQSLYTDWRSFARNEFATVLEMLVAKVDRNWPTHNYIPLFLVDANSEFVMAALKALTTKTKISMFQPMLETVLMSESNLFCSFVDMSYNSNSDNSFLQTQRCDYVQLLVSIPNKVANELHRSSSPICLPELYSEALIVHVLKAIHFICNSDRVNGRELFDMTFLSILFGRISIDFNDYPRALQKAITVLAEWSGDEVYKSRINEIMMHQKRQAIASIVVPLLEHSNIKDIIADWAVSSEDWKYCLLTKIPLLSHFKSNNVPLNLVRYLVGVSKDTNDIRLVYGLLTDLLDIWSNKTCMLRTSVDQHIYITKLCILIVAALSPNDINAYASDIKQKLFNGIPAHLEVLSATLRCIGMITAEIVLSLLDSNAKEGQLQFDYKGCSKDDLAIVESLRAVPLMLTNEQPTTRSLRANDIIEDMLKRISSNSKDRIPVRFQLETKSNKVQTTTSIASAQTTVERELDSDDDLEPYDMTNDVADASAKTPLYLLDLKDGLCEANDPDVFIKSVECCQQLIQDQLPSGDASLGIELLGILLALDSKFAMDNFDEHRFAGCVAACCAHPKECAEFLCAQFNTKPGTYSIGTKLLMLEILSASCKELSKIDNSTAKDDDTKAIVPAKKLLTLIEQDNKKLAAQIVRARVEKKTRRFATRTQHPLRTAQRNRFANVAGSFFFPLLNAVDVWNISDSRCMQNDIDNVLLINFLNTVSTFMLAARNAPKIENYFKEVITVVLQLRWNKDPKIRLANLQLIGTIFLSVPIHVLYSFSEPVLHIERYLVECCSPNVVAHGVMPNEECKQMALNVLLLSEEIRTQCTIKL